MIFTSQKPLGETEVLVTFEYTPVVPAGRRGSPTDSPAEPASVIVTGVMINGVEVDRSFFADGIVQKWERAIELEMME